MMGKRRVASAMSFTSSIIVLFLGLLVVSDVGWRMWVGFAPSSFWFEVGHVSVSDAVEGECPVLKVDRTIHRRFSAEWRASIEQKYGDWYVASGMTGRGEDTYGIKNALPDPLPLWWWMGWRIDHCYVPPGTYRIETTWVVMNDDYPPKTIVVVSNDFTISEKPS